MTIRFPNEGFQVLVWLESNEPAVHKLLGFAVATDMPVLITPRRL